MKKIFLHMGYHKTGSTAIQVYLYKNRENLKEKGVLYPTSACPENAIFGHHILPWSFVTRENYLPSIKGSNESRKADYKLELKKLKDEINSSECDKIIISSEELDILNLEEIRSIFDYFKEYDVHPVIYLRDIADFLQSSYQTAVTYSGYHGEFSDFVNNQRSRLDYHNFIKEINSFSPNKCTVLNYSHDNIKKNLIENFCNLVGIDYDNNDSYSGSEQNSSLNLNTIELIRYYNGKGVDYKYTSKIFPLLYKLPKSNISLFHPDELKKLHKRYKDEIKLIEKEVGKKIPINEQSHDVNAAPKNLIESLTRIFTLLESEITNNKK